MEPTPIVDAAEAICGIFEKSCQELLEAVVKSDGGIDQIGGYLNHRHMHELRYYQRDGEFVRVSFSNAKGIRIELSGFVVESKP